MALVLKMFPEDFRVKETHALHHDSISGNGKYQYFNVRKKNYETFDVVSAISKLFNIDRSEIDFSGLKDKDGITEQYISIERSSADHVCTTTFNEKYFESEDKEKYIHLKKIGVSDEKLKIADLFGNTFDITARSLSEKVYKKLSVLPKINFIFVNYYDIQRFGVSGREKVAHLAGKALEDHDYDNAIKYINIIADSNDILRQPIIDKDDLFARVDKRKLAFYRSSYSSYEWNRHVMLVLKETLSEQQCIREDIHGISFIYVKKLADLKAFMVKKIPYKYKRYTIVNDSVVPIEIDRPEFIQVGVHCSDLGEDEYHEGKYKCRFKFFLSSGCYATMALKQLILNLESGDEC
jgi:tRNA pseudouridine13 synthase